MRELVTAEGRRPVICVYNHKGGVAKTTTAGAIADGLRRDGHKVLVVDCDPQGSLSLIQKAYVADGTCSTMSFMLGGDVVPTGEGQATVPAFEELSLLDEQKGNYLGMLRDAIDRAMDTHGFDVAVLDTHPDANLVSIVALAAATHIVIPCEPDNFAINGLHETLRYISELQEIAEADWEGKIGVLVTRYRSMVSLHKKKIEQIACLCEEEGLELFSERIPMNASIQYAQDLCVPLFEYESVLHGAILMYSLFVRDLCDWVRGDSNA